MILLYELTLPTYIADPQCKKKLSAIFRNRLVPFCSIVRLKLIKLETLYEVFGEEMMGGFRFVSDLTDSWCKGGARIPGPSALDKIFNGRLKSPEI